MNMHLKKKKNKAQDQGGSNKEILCVEAVRWRYDICHNLVHLHLNTGLVSDGLR